MVVRDQLVQELVSPAGAEPTASKPRSPDASLSEAVVDALMRTLTHVILRFLGRGEGAIGG